MTNIYFVRHAESNVNTHDDRARELTEKGLEDRKLVTDFFADKEIDMVLSSPYKRAIDTVKQVADTHGLQIQLINDFRERESGWVSDFREFCKRQWEDFAYKLDEGECLSEVQRRNIAALEKVLHENPGKNIIVGSHGTALGTIINYFDSKFRYEDFEKIRKLMPWIVKFTFEEDKCVEILKIDLFKE